MNEFKQRPNRPTGEKDDFQQIKGIGPSVAKALYDFGIKRFADLVDMGPNDLAEVLKKSIPSISPRRIQQQDWLGQALALASQQNEPESTREEGDQAPVEPPEHNSDSAGGWREVADFFVSFGFTVEEKGGKRLRTKAHHSQADQSEEWEGVAGQELLNWMLEQADLLQALEADRQPIPKPVGSQPDPHEGVSLELSDLWVSQIREPVMTDGELSSGQLRAQHRLKLVGPLAENVTQQQLAFQVELYLLHTESGSSHLAATNPGQLVPGELVYEIQQDFTTPPAGRYQLYVIARLLPPGTAMAHLQGPYVRVEP